MRKSFYQLLQLVEGNITNQHNINQDNNLGYVNAIEQILNSIEDTNQLKTISIQLSLYCAKDCFDYNNETTKPLAEICIGLVEKYLINPSSVTQSSLAQASNNAYAAYYPDASLCASHAARTVFEADQGILSLCKFYAASACYCAASAFYFHYNRSNIKRIQKETQYKTYLITMLSNIEFDNKDNQNYFKQELLKRNHPDHWNSDDWFNFLMMLKDEYDIPLITKEDNYYIINPNFGDYDWLAHTQMELINDIASNPEFRNFRIQLYNKISNAV